MSSQRSRIPSAIQRSHRRQQQQQSLQQQRTTRSFRRSSIHQQCAQNTNFLADETFQIPTGSGSVLLAEYDEDDFFGQLGAAGADESVFALNTPMPVRRYSTRAARDNLMLGEETPRQTMALDEDGNEVAEPEFDEGDVAQPSSAATPRARQNRNGHQDGGAIPTSIHYSPHKDTRVRSVSPSALRSSPIRSSARQRSPLPPSSDASPSTSPSPPRHAYSPVAEQVKSIPVKIVSPTHVQISAPTDPPAEAIATFSSDGLQRVSALTNLSGGIEQPDNIGANEDPRFGLNVDAEMDMEDVDNIEGGTERTPMKPSARLNSSPIRSSRSRRRRTELFAVPLRDLSLVPIAEFRADKPESPGAPDMLDPHTPRVTAVKQNAELIMCDHQDEVQEHLEEQSECSGANAVSEDKLVIESQGPGANLDDNIAISTDMHHANETEEGLDALGDETEAECGDIVNVISEPVSQLVSECDGALALAGEPVLEPVQEPELDLEPERLEAPLSSSSHAPNPIAEHEDGDGDGAKLVESESERVETQNQTTERVNGQPAQDRKRNEKQRAVPLSSGDQPTNGVKRARVQQTFGRNFNERHGKGTSSLTFNRDLKSRAHDPNVKQRKIQGAGTTSAKTTSSVASTSASAPVPAPVASRPDKRKKVETKEGKKVLERRPNDMFERKKRDNYLQRGLDLTRHSTVRFRSKEKGEVAKDVNVAAGGSRPGGNAKHAKHEKVLTHEGGNGASEVVVSEHEHVIEEAIDGDTHDRGVRKGMETYESGVGDGVVESGNNNSTGDGNAWAYEHMPAQKEQGDCQGHCDRGEDAEERSEESGNSSRSSLGGAIAERLAELGQRLMGRMGLLSSGSHHTVDVNSDALNAASVPDSHNQLLEAAPLLNLEQDLTDYRRRSDLRLSELGPSPRKAMPVIDAEYSEIKEHITPATNEANVYKHSGTQRTRSRTRSVSPMRSSRKRSSPDNDDDNDALHHRGHTRAGDDIGVDTGGKRDDAYNDRDAKRPKTIRITAAPTRSTHVEKRPAPSTRNTAVKRRGQQADKGSVATTRRVASARPKLSKAAPSNAPSSRPNSRNVTDGLSARISAEKMNGGGNMATNSQKLPSLVDAKSVDVDTVVDGRMASAGVVNKDALDVEQNSNRDESGERCDRNDELMRNDTAPDSLFNHTSANADSTIEQDCAQERVELGLAGTKRKKDHSKTAGEDARTLACSSARDERSQSHPPSRPSSPPAGRCRLTIPVAPSFTGDVARKNGHSVVNFSTREIPQESGKGKEKAREPLSEKLTFNANMPRTTLPHGFRFSTDIRLERRRQEFDEKLKMWETRALAKSDSAVSSNPNRVHAPIPDFKALQAMFEATQAARREKLKHAPTKPVAPHFALEQRLAEREKFEEARRARELEQQRVREQERRDREEEEELEYREMRKKTVIKANAVPEWYADAPKKGKATAISEHVGSSIHP